MSSLCESSAWMGVTTMSSLYAVGRGLGLVSMRPLPFVTLQQVVGVNIHCLWNEGHPLLHIATGTVGSHGTLSFAHPLY